MDTDDAKCEKMARYNLEIFEFNTFTLHTNEIGDTGIEAESNTNLLH